MVKKSYLLIALLLASPFSFGASFDCAKAATPAEKLICSNDELSKLDEQLGVTYKQALTEATDKQPIKKAQTEWLKEQRACKDAACLIEKYKTRLAALSSPSSTSVTTQSSAPKKAEEKKKMIVTTGYEKPLCNQYLALMQRVPRNPENTCGLEYSFDEKAKAQGFDEIPWQEVDPKKHEDMLLKYWMYTHRTAKEEFRDTAKRQFYDVVLKNKILLWHAVFDLNSDGKLDEVYKLIWRDCMINNASFFIPSEKGFELHKADETINAHGNLFLYRNKVYTGSVWSVQGTSGGDVYVNPGLTECRFKKINGN